MEDGRRWPNEGGLSSSTTEIPLNPENGNRIAGMCGDERENGKCV